jgi:hypothetical protein
MYRLISYGHNTTTSITEKVELNELFNFRVQNVIHSVFLLICNNIFY